MRYETDSAADVAYASAVLFVNNFYAGAPPDTKAELIGRVAVLVQDAIHAYCEAATGAWIVPSDN